MPTIHENYLTKVKEAKRKHQSLLDELKKEWLQEMENCNHSWIRNENLFYFLGETYPGEYCPKCGKQRHIK